MRFQKICWRVKNEIIAMTFGKNGRDNNAKDKIAPRPEDDDVSKGKSLATASVPGL